MLRKQLRFIAARFMHCRCGGDDGLLQRWLALTGAPAPPSLVVKLVNEIGGLKVESKGPHFKIQGDEDKRRRAIYSSLEDSEQKLQYFAAHQIACRLLCGEGYLCDQCWLPAEDCICKKIIKGVLWRGVKLWLYMHPKDFLRKNNTGKLLWQTLQPTGARLCIFGVEEQENAMWTALEKAGCEKVWCVYPERSESDYQVDEIPIPPDFVTLANSLPAEDDACALHFLLMDGTWTNSKAMLSRINVRAAKSWGTPEIPCVALAPALPSAMHDLRPQPSIERTCTAAAASQLLRELKRREELGGCELESSAQLIDASISCLFDALAERRKRGGKPVRRIS